MYSKNNNTISFISFLHTIVQPFYWYIGGYIIVTIIWAIDLSLRPYIFKIILNKITTITPQEVFAHLSLPVGIYLALTFLFIITFRFYDWIILKFNPQLHRHIINTLMNYMFGHSYSFYQNQFAGNLTNKINDIAYGMPNIISTFFDHFLSNLFGLTIAMYTVWYVGSMFAIIMFCWVSIFIAGSLYFSYRSKSLIHKTAEKRARLTGRIVDILTNMISVRLFAGTSIEKKYIHETSTELLHADQQRRWFILKLNMFQGFSFFIFQGSCLWLLMHGIQNMSLTSGDFVLILTINTHLIDSLWNLAKDFTKFTEGLGNIMQALKILAKPHEIKDKSDAKELIITNGQIVFENVHFHYPGTEPLFSNKSITIQAGQKVGLVGYSGSGKSTFVNLILRLFDVQSGRILIDNQDIQDVTQDSLHRAIAMIPQEPALFHRTLQENIRYGRPNATEEDIMDAAKKAHLHEFVMKLPLQYNTLVGERGVKISGGQRQRVAIARAILKKAPILILDEATSQLDSLTEALIQESLFELMHAHQTKTTLVIAHRLSTLLHMDRILAFDDGTIVQDGTHNELLAQDGIYKKLWETQVGGFLADTNDNIV